MKDVNEELEGNTCIWDENQGRWIEPDEVPDEPEIGRTWDLKTEYDVPASWLPVPDVEKLRASSRDIGGNFDPDRIQANLERYKDGPEHD